MGGGGVLGHAPPGNFLDFNSLKSSFLDFWAIQTRYWPVPFCMDEALQIGGLLLSKPKNLKSLLHSLGSSCKYSPMLFVPYILLNHLPDLPWKVSLSYLFWNLIRPISVKGWKLVWIRLVYRHQTTAIDHEVCANFSITYCKGIANSLQK